ncbi:hypothetical protein [Photobacterium kishitanii]|uniref:Uncharacterized protein n=1 Tax=Photobacterium kishitanii TaxID=318456 RepID=A0A2T3KLT1_9GAMM|nr:hypothetical protein [Photobacterium kishitanii]PSV00607.1 hypothetical protein C9J27_05580 [Photobacterium kishitanii]
MASEKKVVAWTVNSEDRGDIVFHHHGLAARRIGAETIDCEFDECECRRAPAFDCYVADNQVPLRVLLNNDWWFECYCCGERVSSGTDRIVFADVIIDECERKVFCNEKCKAKYLDNIDEHNKKYKKFKKDVLEKFPQLTFTDFKGEYPAIYCVAICTFPEAVFPCSVVYDHKGELVIRARLVDEKKLAQLLDSEQ